MLSICTSFCVSSHLPRQSYRWSKKIKQPPDLPLAVFPDGKTAYCIDKREAAFVHDQVQQYLKHGVELKPGDTVFDVGANIGLFSLMAYEKCERDIDLFAFEPIPTTFAALEANIERLESGRLHAFNCGLADRPGELEFVFYPHLTTLSTAYHGSESKNELARQMKQSVLDNLDEVPDDIRNSYRLFRLLRWLPGAIRTRVVDLMVARSLKDETRVSCPIRTVSDIVGEYRVERIDLLKVDVEKAELSVLEGIDEQNWSLVRQTVMEIHDLDGRLRIIREMLEEHGISEIFIEQEPTLQGSNVYSLYARRPDRD